MIDLVNKHIDNLASLALKSTKYRFSYLKPLKIVIFSVTGSLSVPCFYPGVAIIFVLSFLHLPISFIGCSFFKSLGMARGARLLVAVGHGGVRSVRSENKVT